MAQGEGFKHISVTAPEEDDVVIVAGAVEDEVLEEAEEAVEAVEAPVQKQPVRQPAKRPAQKKDDYRETTLDDLKPAPMPLAQRIVIIAAIICIIGAVIYCVAFMR